MFKKHALPLVTLIIIGIFGTKALLQPGFFSSHDGEHQLVRQYIFDRAIKAGHIPPRFDRQLYNHLGYPLFTFTYQLPFWIGEGFMSMGFSIPNAVKATFILTYILSGITMYVFTQERWGKLGGLMAAFLYLWAPYRFLSIFVRASLGEHTAFIFLPLLLWALSRPTRVRLTVGSISIFGLLLSHSMFAQLSAMPIILFWLAEFWQQKNKKFFILHSSFIILLGLGLSAYYLIPAMYYRSAIQGLNSTFYAEHFVTLKQLIYSKWGYTFSFFGENDGMSFQIGFAQWIAMALGVGIILKDIPKKLHRPALALVASFIVSIFLMTDPSSKIWEQAVKKWFVIDLPWRFLAISTFTTSAMAAFVVSNLRNKLSKAIFCVFLFSIAVYTNRNHLRINERLDFDHNWFANYTGTSNSYDEYKPVSTSQDLLKQPPLPAVTIEKGIADVHVIDDKPQRLFFDLDAKTDINGRINTVYFPGWQIYINGAPGDISQLTQGVPALRLPPGRYNIMLTYEQTNITLAAELISLASSAIVAIIIIYDQIKRHRRHAGI